MGNGGNGLASNLNHLPDISLLSPQGAKTLKHASSKAIDLMSPTGPKAGSNARGPPGNLGLSLDIANIKQVQSERKNPQQHFYQGGG